MNTLLSIYGAGVASLIVLFILCFFFVHLARLVRIGWHAQKRANTTKAPQTAQPTQKAQSDKTTGTKSPPATEPIYYIVERKRRVKSGYSEPKQIRFK